MTARRAIRVLHCPDDVGGHPSTLARAERELGLESTSLVLVESPFGYTADVVLRRSGDGRLRFEARRVEWLIRAATSFDVVHFNFGRSLAPARPFRLADVPLLRRLGKKIVVTFQGDDVRQGDVARRRFELSTAHELPEAYSSGVDKARRRTVQVFSRCADRLFFLNPDLAYVLPDRAEFLPYASVDLSRYRPIPPPANRVPVVVHAPSDRRVKGTHYVLEAVDRLQRSGIAVELRLVEGLTRDAAVPLYADGDVFVDQLIAGWYGGAAVEAMALGRPVIAFIREDDLSLIPEAMRDELPVVNATPETIDGSLRKLVEATAEEREAAGRAVAGVRRALARSARRRLAHAGCLLRARRRPAVNWSPWFERTTRRARVPPGRSPATATETYSSGLWGRAMSSRPSIRVTVFPDGACSVTTSTWSWEPRSSSHGSRRELGVSSTYFVMLRSAFYNLFGRDNHDAVHALVGLGHRIGLHYDAAYKPPGEVTRSHAASIELEAAFLESMFSIPVRTVSFHQPSFGPDPGEMHPRGLVSAWNMPGYAYVSDANKSEGMSRTEELLASGLRPAFQLLVHPIWWATDDPTATTEELFDRAMLANLEREQEQILAVERAFGARRSFTIAREEP